MNRIVAIFLIAIYFATPTFSSSLRLINANLNRNSLVNGDLVSVLQGDVEFEYKGSHIKANSATWYRRDGRILFRGGVTVDMEHQSVSCKRMVLDKRRKKLIATKKVNFYDSLEMIRFTAGEVVYNFDSKVLVLTKKPIMNMYDTTANDTLIITGKKMTYTDSIKTAFVNKNVVIIKGELNAKCQKAEYSNKTGIAHLRVDPIIHYEIHELEGDSVDLEFTDNRLSGLIVMRNAKAFYQDISPTDTAYTKMRGDSIYLSIMKGGGIDTIWTVKDASTTYYTSSNPTEENRATGKFLILNFLENKSGNLLIKGNAESIFYVEDNKGTGINRATGNEILIHFANGKAGYIRLRGRARGTYSGES